MAPCLPSTPTIYTTATTLYSSIARDTPRRGCALLQGVPRDHRVHQALPIPYAVSRVGPTCSAQADKPPALATRLGGAFPFYSILHKAHAKAHECSLIRCGQPSWRSSAISSASSRAPRTSRVTRATPGHTRACPLVAFTPRSSLNIYLNDTWRKFFEAHNLMS